MGENDRALVLAQERIDMVDEIKIIGIKAGANHSYVVDAGDNYFLFGRNHLQQCTLRKEYGIDLNLVGIINSPFRINEPFEMLTKGKKRIKKIHLGQDNTWIIAGNKEE